MSFFDIFKSSSQARPTNICVCDICDQEMKLFDGYLLTTKEIITQQAYWEYAFKNQWNYVHNQFKNAHFDVRDKFLADLIKNQASQKTSWSVCESCASLLEFDKSKAKMFAQQNVNPPQTGRAGFNDAMKAAEAVQHAWNRLYRNPKELPVIGLSSTLSGAW